MAFVSLWVQVEGLYGASGIAPLNSSLGYWQSKLGDTAFWQKPSLLWWKFTDYDHHILLGIGVLSSLAMLTGAIPLISSFVCWIAYLSFVSVGSYFMSFQWDNLLLEMGFITLFLHPKATPRFVIWPYRFLLFRLMFASGMVKIASGDVHWESLKALDYHYLTQPLPNFISWFVYHFPSWFHQLSVIFMFIVELACPFFIFFFRRFRLVAFYMFLFLQVAIMVTGNYGFFNWLTIVLCFSLVDDDHWNWYFNAKTPMDPGFSHLRGVVTCIFTVYVLAMGSMQILTKRYPRFAIPFVRVNYNFRLVNSYGLFAVMTTKRREILIQGSRDNVRWRNYKFKYKPNGVKDRPRFLLFHMPRLDWQMWFAALRSRPPRWFNRFCNLLSRGDKGVIGLLEENPFPGRPPRYIRAVIFDYKFSSIDELFEEEKWWKRRYGRIYRSSVPQSD
ncbi:MAG: lipase maturation factor family protein [Halobacteriovoraceae bacterium]|nr:lipase maturation factor family protein [Halobacteriovoraceae bacterium]